MLTALNSDFLATLSIFPILVVSFSQLIRQKLLSFSSLTLLLEVSHVLSCMELLLLLLSVNDISFYVEFIWCFEFKVFMMIMGR